MKARATHLGVPTGARGCDSHGPWLSAAMVLEIAADRRHEEALETSQANEQKVGNETI